MKYGKQNLTISIIILLLLTSCQDKIVSQMKNQISGIKKESRDELTCKLSGPELQQRKATVLASLRKQIIEKKELIDGYAFKFSGSDSVIDELTTFVKTERECCDFFNFTISISGDKSEAWLQLTGTKGAKEFIRSELEL